MKLYTTVLLMFVFSVSACRFKVHPKPPASFDQFQSPDYQTLAAIQGAVLGFQSMKTDDPSYPLYRQNVEAYNRAASVWASHLQAIALHTREQYTLDRFREVLAIALKQNMAFLQSRGVHP